MTDILASLYSFLLSNYRVEFDNHNLQWFWRNQSSGSIIPMFDDEQTFMERYNK